jgi:hypothetical protein
MLDEDFARIRAHRNNIHRYRRLLKTRLSDLERRFIERRMSEQTSALEALTSRTFPLTFDMAEAPTLATAGAAS